MACRWLSECLLKILNFLLMLAGLAMIGYGIYMFIEWKQSSNGIDSGVVPPKGGQLINLGRPLLLQVTLANNILDKLPKAWFIYLFIAVGAILVIVSCSGCVATASQRGCCLCCHILLFVLLILAELALAGFIFFDHQWEEVIPEDKTGQFYKIKDFLEKNIKIVRWVALGVVVLEIFAVILAFIVRSYYSPPEYDSDDEYLSSRPQARQPLLSRQPTQNAGPSAPVPDQRVARTDAWSTRMREKYGLDTSEFTYNPSESNRYAPSAPPPPEEKGRCTVM
eukprot:TRINITY_DN494_c0_g1_i1.p1 TRINITY_DN494_c0_g1~~TRINITY_DN494_c0_g1_i1.p1  ORF type:complete len:280 (-),score=23.83 TRINITY_DN494_c0_g1_i1:454-1293(-)